MTLLLVEGFDVFGTTNADMVAQLRKKYTQSAVSSSVVLFESGRYGVGAALGLGSAGFLDLVIPTAAYPGPTTLVVGFAMKFQTSTTPTSAFLTLADGGVDHINLVLNTGRKIQVRRSVTVLGTSTTPILFGPWYYIELKVLISNTVGTVQLRINGITEVNLTGQDTNNGSVFGDTINIIRLTGNILVIPTFDDLYVLDTNGAVNNDFLGDIRVETLTPTGAGNYSQFTPTGASPNYAAVDNNPASDSIYNVASTVGLKDTFTFSDLSYITSVKAIGSNLGIRRNSSTQKRVKPISRISSTDYSHTANALPVNFEYETQIIELNPATSSTWTAGEINDLEHGYEITV